MAIYHFSAKVISRASGSSALASAAYRSASRLHDQRLDRHHDFSNKAGVIHSEVMMPEGAPEHLAHREKLWNEVEAVEKRIDAQLAREIEFAIPRELDRPQGIRLASEFVQREFVDRGMIADLNVHWDIGADGEAKPHAHVMLTMRSVDEDGFGAKVRDWNRTDLLNHWREVWAEHVNTRLAQLDIDARVDHRSLEAQGIDLEPQHKIGAGAARMAEQGLESERLDEHRDIARRNGERILARPALVLDAITHSQATFTTRDLARFVHRHSDGKEQFDRVMAAVRGSFELVALGRDGHGEQRFTSRNMLEVELRMERAVEKLANRDRHHVPAAFSGGGTAGTRGALFSLTPEQRDAVRHITSARDLSLVVGYAGTGKSTMLGVAREAWEAEGYTVRGAALSGIAAENLEQGSGIASRTITSLEHQWARERDRLTAKDVLVLDEAGMIGSRQMERVVSEVEKRGAKLVLVGDPEQLQAIEAGAAFRSIAERHGAIEITSVRRQREDWQRDATRQLATGRTGEAIRAYDEHGLLHLAETREQARVDLIDRWDRARAAAPDASRMILTHTNDEVRELNIAARERLRQSGGLGDDVTVRAERGARAFAPGDRIIFLRNERSLGVKNGSLGRVDSVTAARMAVMIDDGRAVAFDLKDYAQIDHGYAATVHKAQGVTVDWAHVLATPGLDRHAAYVALSRHRDSIDLHYGRDDFADQGKLVRTLSRERAKDMASDYAGEFADRRQIRIVSPMPEHGPLAAVRDPLAALGLESPRRPTPEMGGGTSDHSERTKAPARLERAQSPGLGAAVARHGRIVAGLRFAQSVGEPITPEQRAELSASRMALNTMSPHGALDLETAFSVNPRLIREAANGRTDATVRAMELEARLRDDPRPRADTFVQRWQALDRQRRLLLRDYEERRADKVAQTMAGMAKSLERDPQVESLLRARKSELGLPAVPERSVGRSLADMIARGRSRGLDIGM